MNQGKQPIMEVFMIAIILGSTVAIGYMLQPVAAQLLIPPSCPPELTQAFERGVCIGPDPELTYQCDTEPAGLELVGDQCVIRDEAGQIIYKEPAILVDAECRGPFGL